MADPRANLNPENSWWVSIISEGCILTCFRIYNSSLYHPRADLQQKCINYEVGAKCSICNVLSVRSDGVVTHTVVDYGLQ